MPSGETICVLDRLTGLLERALPLGGRLDTAPAAADGMAYATCDDGGVYAFTLSTGELTWKTTADGPFDAAPLIREGVVYAATMAGTVYALDAATGAVTWRTSVSSRAVAVTPALSADGLLFVAADDGFLHVIAAETGNLIRSRRVSDSPLRSSPVCSGHTVFVGADDGDLYALDADYAVQPAYETTPARASPRRASPSTATPSSAPPPTASFTSSALPPKPRPAASPSGIMTVYTWIGCWPSLKR